MSKYPEEYGGMFCWGEGWRMPTFDEMKELMEQCTWTKTQIGETLGFEVKGPNGSTIFLPAAGSGFKEGINPRNLYGNYWSSTLDTDATKLGYEANPDVACGLRFEIVEPTIAESHTYRSNGCSVRPVTIESEE